MWATTVWARARCSRRSSDCCPPPAVALHSMATMSRASPRTRARAADWRTCRRAEASCRACRRWTICGWRGPAMRRRPSRKRWSACVASVSASRAAARSTRQRTVRGRAADPRDRACARSQSVDRLARRAVRGRATVHRAGDRADPRAAEKRGRARHRHRRAESRCGAGCGRSYRGARARAHRA